LAHNGQYYFVGAWCLVRAWGSARGPWFGPGRIRAPMALYLGFDASTQSLTALAIEVDGRTRRVVCEHALVYDEALPAYGTRHGVLPSSEPSQT